MMSDTFNGVILRFIEAMDDWIFWVEVLGGQVA